MSKVHNGWLIIVGVISQIIGWVVFYPANPADENSVQAAAIRGDETMAYVGLIMGFGGMIAMLYALRNVALSMEADGGKGSSYAGAAGFVFLLAAAGALVCTGFEFSVHAASSNMSAAMLMGNSLAVANGIILGIGTANVLLGIAILVTKKVYPVVGALAILVGIAMLLTPFLGQDSMIGGIGWLGWAITSIGIGFHSIRSAD